MHKKVYFLFFLLSAFFIGLSARAQDTAAGKPVEMADRFRADGKIYVVIAVLVTILLGLLAYVIRLDRKIGQLEKNAK